jgi:2-C-methyl-D-erythritol 4-phosphate cytidylyltransferase
MEIAMKTTAIILAGGKGSRMNADIPKQYIKLFGKPLLYYTMMAFQESCVDEIVVVTGNSKIKYDFAGNSIEGREADFIAERDYCKRLASDCRLDKVRSFADGGAERYNSVMNGLKCVSPDTDVVLVHDGARPCIEPALIDRCVADVTEFGSGVVAVPAKDTIKVVGADGYVTDTPDRSSLWQIQTPQGFLYSELMDAYGRLGQSIDEGCELKITDDAMVMEQFGKRGVHITMGSYTNIKATTREDLEILKIFLKRC